MKAAQNRTKILKNFSVSEQCFKIILEGSRLSRAFCPGQFAMIRVNDNCLPLLRRPLSIHNVCGRKIELLYEVVGKGTEILSQKKAGEYLDVIGPLGNGFSVIGSRLSVLVAGGMGTAPLLFLAKKLITRTPDNPCLPAGREHRKPIILIGAKTKSHILCEKEFKKLGCDVKIATDDGSQGFSGRVTELLKKMLSANRYLLSAIYACGPKPMLEEISKISLAQGIPAQISLEAHMACGVGACLGCVVSTAQGFKRVCKDGPVFDASEIRW